MVEEPIAAEAQVENQEEPGRKKIKVEHAGDDLDVKILRQVEYYFSDVNIINDKFLLAEFKKDEGWVKLATLLTFTRLKALAKEEDVLIKALKESQSDIIEFDETKKGVRRKNPVPDAEEFRKNLNLRTVHISGFPTDYTYDMLKSFCLQFGKVEALHMRLHFKTRFFKGCIHVVFKSEEDAKKVLDTEDLKWKDRELRKESMKEYHRRKEEMRQKKIEKRKSNKKDKKDQDS